MRRNCAAVAISDIHRDELINFLSTFKFLMGVYDCTLSLIMALVIVQKNSSKLFIYDFSVW